MCPLVEQCGFYRKFSSVRHESLQKMISVFCTGEDGHLKCVHYQMHSTFGMELDPHVSPACQIIPRPS